MINTERTARCVYYGEPFTKKFVRGRSECRACNERTDNICQCQRPSSQELPFLEETPDKLFDKFYCGCSGWD